jgi:hypothetical protein
MKSRKKSAEKEKNTKIRWRVAGQAIRPFAPFVHFCGSSFSCSSQARNAPWRRNVSSRRIQL